MNTTLHQNWAEETQNWTNLYLEPHDYWIYYVNIDLHHQYRISVAESQTFLYAKRPQLRRARRKGCFRRLQTPGFSIKLTSQLNNSNQNRCYNSNQFCFPGRFENLRFSCLIILQYNDNDNVKYNDDDDEKLVFQSKPRQNYFVFHLQKNPSTIRIPEDDIGSDSHIMDHVVSLTSTDVLDKNLTELCRDAGKVLFKGTDPKLLLSGM